MELLLCFEDTEAEHTELHTEVVSKSTKSPSKLPVTFKGARLNSRH